MRTLPPSGFLLLTLFFSFDLGHAHADESPALEVVKSRCLRCHSTDKKRGALDLSQRQTALTGGESGPALVPGMAQASLLIQRVTKSEMPPQKKLEPGEIAALRQWIEAGAPYPTTPLTDSPASWW